MNRIWPFMVLIACVLLIISRPQDITSTMLAASTNAVTLSIRLVAIYAVWMGILNILDAVGFSKILAKALSPLIRLIFGNIPEDAKNYISLNFSANMLGLGGAATPMGIKAVESLDKHRGNTPKIYATQAMIMLVVINAASIQIIPTTVISLRETAGSENATAIVLPAIIANFTSTFLAIILVKILGTFIAREKNFVAVSTSE
ncbi:MAG: hypothetical protein FWB72_03465 [Firmicutes bacterium]|nr:hypothetical protein [Bacillota bacterium]